MSTRSIIGYKDGDDIKAVYHHWDGYPTGVGHTILNLIHGLWHPKDADKYDIVINGKQSHDIGGVQYTPENAVRAFCSIYIDGHPSGWSVMPDTCHCHDPQFVIRDGGKRPDELLTSKDVSSLWHEWMYIIDREACTLQVWSAGTGKSYKYLRATKDDWTGGYRLVGTVDLKQDTVPDLENLESADSEFKASDK